MIRRFFAGILLTFGLGVFLFGCLSEYDSVGYGPVVPLADGDEEAEVEEGVSRPSEWPTDYEREVVESVSVADVQYKQERHYDLNPIISNISCGQIIRDLHYEKYPSYDVIYAATDLGLCVMNSNYPGIFVPVVALGIPEGGFVAISRFDNGQLVAASVDTIFVGESTNWQSFAMPEGSDVITTIRPQGDSLVWVGTFSGVYLLDISAETDPIQKIDELDGKECRAVEVFDDKVWIATDQGVYVRESDTSQFEVFDENLIAFDIETRYVPSLELWFGTDHGVHVIPYEGEPFDITDDQPTGDETHVFDAIPKLDVLRIHFSDDGTPWLSFVSGGVARWMPERGWHYYQSKRWLPEDHVFAIEGRSSDFMLFGTQAGIGVVYTKLMTMEDKANEITNNIKLRHDRHGLVAGSELLVPGDLSTNHMHDHDNDGLWTSIWVASQCFRYGATKDIDALGNARKSVNAMMFLQQVTEGTKEDGHTVPSGFVARSIVLQSEREKPDYGEWHSSKDGVWWWKGDTSSDEIDGHMFGYTVYYDICADRYEKEKIRDTVGKILDHIIDHGYKLVDVDGKGTKWGYWDPESINGPIGLLGLQGLRSLEILSYLTVGYHMFKNVDKDRAEKYLWHKYYLINEHHYLENTLKQKDITVGKFENNSDDELAFLTYYVFNHVEDDPYIKSVIDESLKRAFKYEKIEDSSLFNFVYASVFGLEQDVLDGALRHLRWYPTDLIEWYVKNSDRTDLMLVEYDTPFNPHLSFSNWFIKKNGQVVPVDERRIMKWNGSPFRMDGGNGGREEDDGAAYLLPYWMGRYYGFITEPVLQDED